VTRYTTAGPHLTEHVLCIAATALFCGFASRNGGGNLCRNLDRIVGLPRGANEGLKDREDASASSRLGTPVESSPPSPIQTVNKLGSYAWYNEEHQSTFEIIGERRVLEYDGFHGMPGLSKVATVHSDSQEFHKILELELQSQSQSKATSRKQDLSGRQRNMFRITKGCQVWSRRMAVQSTSESGRFNFRCRRLS